MSSAAFDVQAFVQQQIAIAAMPTPIPGWTYADIVEGTEGANRGRSILDMTDARLQDPALSARCNAWYSAVKSLGGKKGLKDICKQAKLKVGGNLRVLALRLAYAGKSPPQASASAPAVSSSSAAASPSAPSSYGGSSSSAGPNPKNPKKRSSSSSSSGSNKKKRRTAKSLGLTK